MIFLRWYEQKTQGAMGGDSAMCTVQGTLHLLSLSFQSSCLLTPKVLFLKTNKQKGRVQGFFPLLDQCPKVNYFHKI